MHVFRIAVKKILKTIAPSFPINRLRILLLRLCGYNIGNEVYIGERLLVIDELHDRNNIFIGDRVAIAPCVILITSSQPNFSRIRKYLKAEKGPIHIENDAWIGAGSIIYPNVTIGQGAVVGAGAVVKRDVDPYTVVAGIPAKKISEVIVT
jgi:acetyltransferase-like isoleucine patch superfamily enzyme